MNSQKTRVLKVLLLTIIALILVFDFQPPKSIAHAHATSEVHIAVPYHSQDRGYYCGPACLEMIFDFYGPDIPQEEIADAARTDGTFPNPYGTYSYEMRRSAHFSDLSTSAGELITHVTGYTTRGLGYAAFEYQLTTIAQLTSLIDAGYPVGVLQWNNLTHNWGHFRVVVGYDDAAQTITVHDPLPSLFPPGQNNVYSYADFNDLWGYSDKWALFASPWDVDISYPTEIMQGDTFTVTATITYPRPSLFSAGYSASSSQATIQLPPGLSLVAGETSTKYLGTIPSGGSATAQWDVNADSEGSYSITVEAEGRVTGSVSGHPSGVFTTGYTYTDRIGGTSSEDVTIVPACYVFSKTSTYTWSENDLDPWGPNTVPFTDRFNITFSQPDENGVIMLTVPKESYHCELAYDEVGGATGPFTWQLTMTSDGYGKMYTLDDAGDVDIRSMTSDAGTFFWKDGAWYPASEEWIGDGIPDPAGSSWLYLPLSASVYEGDGTSGPLYGTFWLDFWLTTGFSENTVVEPASRLNGFCMNRNGNPFDETIGMVTYVITQARLNIPWISGPLDLQYEAERCGTPPPAFMATLFSPANLYVTDPENRHVGTDPNTGEVVNEILGAFYSGPGSEPQRVIIPDPLDGVYEVEIIGTSTGTYTLVVELATVIETTTQIYTGDIIPEAILKSKATVSEGEITSTTPVSIIGDVNVDGIVDIFDLRICAKAFGCKPGDINWNPIVDLNQDGPIDIFDLRMIAKHYGETWP